MPAKLVVTATAKGSRIALIGSSGKHLLTSAEFTEPRAKGATLRALRGILGQDIVVEDETTGRNGSNGAGPVDSIGVPARKAAKKVARKVAKAPAARKIVRKVEAASRPAKRTGRRAKR